MNRRLPRLAPLDPTALFGDQMSPFPPQSQIVTLRIGTRPLSMDAKVDITAQGLLSIAALVSSVLLATAVLVRAARK